MSGFTALNVEPEDTIEEEIDDTKEIQIEEALKQYQNALKLHSQGPDFYAAAAEAYHDLFQSEVFKYPEVISDYSQDQLDDSLPIGNLPAEEESIPLVPGTSADSAANALPQLVYLAYKSRAQFILDAAYHDLQQAADPERRELYHYYHSYCLKSLADSANALERDDTDLDLWKKAARISEVLASQRLARFCLESVLAGDDESVEQTIDLSGLDEALACGQLNQVLDLLGDDLSRTKVSATKPKQRLLELLRKSNDPYSFLPQRSENLEYIDERRKPAPTQIRAFTIRPVTQTRVCMTETLVDALERYENAIGGIGTSVRVVLPRSHDAEHGKEMLDNPNLSTELATSHQASEAQLAEQDKSSVDGSMKSPASFHSAKDEMHQETDAATQIATANPVDASTDLAQPQEPTLGKDSQDVREPIRMPTRKRSSTVAGIEEPESRIKSKRLRARESLLELAAQDEDTVQDFSHYNREQLAILEDADEKSLVYLDMILTKLNIAPLGDAGELRRTFWQEETIEAKPAASTSARGTEILLADMRQALLSWTDEKSIAVISGHGSRDVERSSGLTLFLKHLKADTTIITEATTPTTEDIMLGAFANQINTGSATLYDTIFLWLCDLVTSQRRPGGQRCSYLFERWSDDLRHSIMQLLVQADEQLYYIARSRFEFFDIDPSNLNSSSCITVNSSLEQVTELIQSVFELHLDLYISQSGPEADVDDETKVQQFDRLQRWAHLATDFMRIRFSDRTSDDDINSLILRFVWTSVKLVSQLAGDDKSHVLLCLQDLRILLEQAGNPAIPLPNNNAMPQISVAAIEQESSRLTTLDFFMSVFDSDDNDPIAVIMKLEPLLERGGATDEDVALCSPTSNSTSDSGGQTEHLHAFLNSGDASLKLFLWRRLQNAYTAINYTPKVVSCLLRSSEIIAEELQTERHLALNSDIRQIVMLRWIRDADDILAKVLNRVADEVKAFECLDELHLKSSISAIVFLLRTVHGFVLFDDSVRVGQTPTPTMRPSSSKSFEKSKDKLRDTYVRLWTLLFHLLREATIQDPERFERPSDELAEYLRKVHHALGQRQYCRNCNKMFVKLAKSELLTLRSELDYSQDLAQILYDMYQIKIGVGVGDEDHGCTPDLLRDKTTAVTLVPIIMNYVRKLNMKDLIKSELKGTIDKIQHCLGPVKASPNLTSNKKVISTYLKSQISPQAVYRSLKGIGDLTTKSVHSDYARIASTGWYLLLGKINLAKFKSIKRVNPTATDDLDTAAAFLRHDLEHNIASWESWYRLAQVFDSKIEDCLIWNAVKLNDAKAEIVLLERNAINAYTMAITMAMRSADDTGDSVQDISDMFSEFAFRLYASSRPPLNMEAFRTDKHLRHISNSQDQTMSKAPFVHPFRPYTVWGFAAYLLRRKFRASSKEWYCHYTLGKCLWKMFQSDENANAKHPVVLEQVLEAFCDAVELVPKKEKSTDYILEPHYKLVSIVHKLVHRNLLEPSKGIEFLSVTQFAKGARISEDEQGQIEWEPYILDILKNIGHADKSNWHHRITARAAHVIYDDEPDRAGALGAKHQFTQQIFTKTMTMQVWKPEHERPGRHYVYTGRYLSFFVHLLDQLQDRELLEQLVKRIRRKPTDYIDHPRVWEQTASTYLKLLRRHANIPDGQERAIFDRISFEEFSKMSDKIEKWAHQPDTKSVYLETIADAIELKKLNNSLMKGPLIDDLIGDAYTSLYEEFVSQLPPDEVAANTHDTTQQSTFINMTADTAPTGDDNLDRMRLNNLLSNQSESLGNTVLPITLGSDTPNRATPPMESLRSLTSNKPGRVKTITRREVQRKAEAAINRPPPVKTPTTGKKIVVEIPRIQRNGSEPENEDDIGRQNTLESREEHGGSKSNSRQPSIAGSNRASEEPEGAEENDIEVDDESELTDIETLERLNQVDDDADGDGDDEAEAEVDSDGNNDENDEDQDEGPGDDEDREDEGQDEEDNQEDSLNQGLEDTMNVDEDNDEGPEIQDSQEQDENQSEGPVDDMEVG